MNQAQFLKEVVQHLEQAGLPYMVTGSVASGRYGEIRTTYDTDIVVDAEWPAVREFVRGLGEEYYVSEEAARAAWARRSMFNVIHFRSGNKADIICRKDRHYSRVAFGRRRRETVLATQVHIISAEDIILAKLDWSKRGESERQYRDALGVAKAQGPSLDTEYLARWAKDLNLTELLQRLLADADLAPS